MPGNATDFGTQLHRATTWRPPADWIRIQFIDAHTAGEPLRVIVGGWPELPGATILARRRYAQRHHDHLRKALMWEPRGHADMYGCIITPPATATADFGVLFLHNEGFSTMCGHGIIAVTKVALATGLVPTSSPLTTMRIDSPAGLITSRTPLENGVLGAVAFENVPSFVLDLDQKVDVPGLGEVSYDLAFGGAFYAYVQAEAVGVGLEPEDYRDLIDIGRRIKRAVMASRPVTHPDGEDLSFLYGTILVGPPCGTVAHSRNVCIFAEGEVDRSPTGTGVSGRLAILHARGEIDLGQEIVVESILGTLFAGCIVGTTTCGPHPAVVPEVRGEAHVVGAGELWLDPADPLRFGFMLR